jgi:hypothetical protein
MEAAEALIRLIDNDALCMAANDWYLDLREHINYDHRVIFLTAQR